MPVPPFQRLLDEHAGAVFRLLVVEVGRTDADDCFQETFLAALRAYPPRHADNLRSWLLTIAHRKAIDHHRARGRAPIPMEELPEPPATAATAATADADGDLDLPAEAWEHARSLPETQRAALALRFAADLPHEEIAAILGTSPEAVRRRQATAIATLRRALQKEPA
jgi:RNA polymerase sigma factor (sigma-70 family)